MQYVLDIECYQNYFLMMFVPTEGETGVFEMFNDEVTENTVPALTHNDTIITFNGIGYDMPMWSGLQRLDNQGLKDLSDDIIVNGRMWWEISKHWGLPPIAIDHIDIMPILPLQASLKIYGGRIHSKRLQDLPIEPSAVITDEQRLVLRDYCEHSDCKVTWQLFHEVAPQIELRRGLGAQYGLDLRSKSDAQIAEVVIASEYQRRTGEKLWKPDSVEPSYKYTPPTFVGFHSEVMKEKLAEICAADFTIKESNGQVEEPPCLKKPVNIGGVKYKMGLGGLHSVDKAGSFYSDDEYVLFDIDVASYYPFIILNAGFYPERIGPVFLDIYREIVETRIKAKRVGDKVTSATLKIVINGTFGKTGSKYSKIYAPDLMFHTTVTGQLCLLMLIEQFTDKVVSANTDGITVRLPRADVEKCRGMVTTWEQHTGFEMEWLEYKSVHRRDVNNYIAITADGKVKHKGVFAKPSVWKNPANPIIPTAVEEYFLNGVPVDETIRGCDDITQFLTLRTVRGGGRWGSEVLGKSVRWYHSWLSAQTINYITNGNKVPLSDGSVPLMNLCDTLPGDVDYQWYITEAEKLKGIML